MKPLLYTLLCLLMVLSGCESAVEETKQDSNTLVLGVLLSKNDFGNRGTALRTAIEEINDSGGINGMKIKAEFRRHGDNTAIGVDNAQSMLSDYPNLIGFVTSWSSRSRAITLEVGEPNKVPTISGSSTANANTGLSDYFHRTAPADKYQTAVLAEQAKKAEYGIKHVAVATQDNDTYTQGLSSGFREAFGDSTMTNEVFFVDNETEMKEKVLDLFSSDPDAVFISMLPKTLLLPFFETIDQNISSEKKAKLRFIMPDALFEQFILEGVNPDFLVDEGLPDRVIGSVPAADAATATHMEFEQEIRTRFSFSGAPSFGANFYDIGFVYAIAIKRAMDNGYGVSNMDSLRIYTNKYIREIAVADAGDIQVSPVDGWSGIVSKINNKNNIDYLGASGSVDFDSGGDVKTNYNLWKVIKNADGSRSFKIEKNVPAPDL